MGQQLMADSLDLLLYGMGVVYVFLIVLVVVTAAMSRVINHFFPQLEPEVLPREAKVPGVDPLTLKVIQAALDKHRSRN